MRSLPFAKTIAGAAVLSLLLPASTVPAGGAQRIVSLNLCTDELLLRLADPAKVACDYPPYELNKLIAKKFEDSGSPAVDLVKNFTLSNDDQNIVSTYIAKDEMKPEDAAKKWVEDNPDKVDAWLK